MGTQKMIFVDRRTGKDRRNEHDPCKGISLDLYHRKRRKSKERRDMNKSLTDDYYAYMQNVMEDIRNSNTTTATSPESQHQEAVT